VSAVAPQDAWTPTAQPPVTVGWLTADVDEERKAVRLTVTGPPAGTAKLTIWRVGSQSGALAYVRGAAPPGAAYAAPYMIRDFEAPLEVPVAYYAQAFNAGGAALGTVGPLTYTLQAGDDRNPWLVDIARPLNSEQVVVESFGPLEYPTVTGVHRVLNRRTPVVTSDLAYTPGGKLVFVTATDEEAGRARNALSNGVPVLLRVPPEQGVGNIYLSVTGFTETRVSRIALYEDRRFEVDVVQVSRPDPTLYLPAPPNTYQVVRTVYASYADLRAQRPTYDSVLYDYSAGTAPVAPWPPADV
jgi:hypothetical protein